MALTKFKQPEPVENFYDGTCSFPGCSKKWAVQMEGSKPMCSHHQWDKSSKKPSTLPNKTAWYEINDNF